MSGGEKKKVAIAGVVAMEPEIIILDEPLSNLDPAGASEIVELLNELKYIGKTIIISTHDVDLASGWADVVYVLNRGKVYNTGHPSRIFADRVLMENTKLKLPTIVETFREFEARGIADGHAPMTLLDLVDSVEGPYIGVRCAVADHDIPKGQQVGLFMREGTIVAVPYTQQKASGLVLASGGMAELVKQRVDERNSNGCRNIQCSIENI